MPLRTWMFCVLRDLTGSSHGLLLMADRGYCFSEYRQSDRPRVGCCPVSSIRDRIEILETDMIDKMLISKS